jgi:hypothetical protein
MTQQIPGTAKDRHEKRMVKKAKQQTKREKLIKSGKRKQSIVPRGAARAKRRAK